MTSTGTRRGVFGSSLVVVASALVLGGCFGEDEKPGATAGDSRSSSSTPACGYLYEWTSAWRFPLQPDPHAAYSYVVPKVTTQPVGFRITGPLPYAAWTSWTIYNAKAQPYSLVADSSIKPDKGSVSPFVVGTPVLSKKRYFSLLVVPKGTDAGQLAPPLREIPSPNVLRSPDNGKYFIIANRVYDAFPGYNRGGAAGPTKTPFPQVEALNLETGERIDCTKQNLVPSPKPSTEMPTPAASRSPSPAVIRLSDGTGLALGSRASSASGDGHGLRGAQFAPALDPDEIEMTRPPLLPGGDVSSIPPPDNCSGYLGAAMSTTKIGLIRMPHVARWFDTAELTPKTPFEQQQATYISLTQYGASGSVYDPGSPESASVANTELKVDKSGGATIVVWPRSLSSAEQQKVFAYAERQGWAVLRGGESGPVTTANLIVRLKGAAPDYGGAYSPGPGRPGVPCYFDDHPNAQRWSDVSGDKYVASSDNLGTGAPQGVNCTPVELLDGECRDQLETYIANRGGSYTAR